MKTANVVTAVGIITFIACIGLGAWAWAISANYRAPISAALPILTTILPSVDFFTTYRSIVRLSTASAKRNGRPLSVPLLSTNLLFLVLPAVLLALSATYLQDQPCQLKEQWQSWFSAHDSRAIKGLQDKMTCCGFGTTTEMPYPPFSNPTKPKDGSPGKPGVPADTCAKALGALAAACYPLWQEKIKQMSGLLVSSNLIMMVMKFLFMTFIMGKPDLMADIFTNQKYNGYTQPRGFVDEGDEEEDGPQAQRRPPRMIRNNAGQEDEEREDPNDERRTLLPSQQVGGGTDAILDHENQWK